LEHIKCCVEQWNHFNENRPTEEDFHKIKAANCMQDVMDVITQSGSRKRKKKRKKERRIIAFK
jgi:hypothetical protein